LIRRTLILGAVAFLGSNAEAGVYGPEDVSPFAIRPDGTAEELPYVPNFKSMLDDRLNAGNPKAPLEENGKPTYRGRLVQRVETLWPSGGFTSRIPASVSGLSLDRQVDLAADMIRLGRADDAVALLQPRARDRNPDFKALVTLSQAYAARGEWDSAIQTHADAFELAPRPVTLPGANAAQTKWVLEVEKGFVARWLALRKAEAASREPVETHDLLGLFPVRFVNDKGEYQPGTLAAAEKAKLRPDAVAIVQQLLLWSPDDPRLLWLLAELTAAAGRLREAAEIFDQCTWGRGFTNRKKLMDHRTAVATAANAQPAPKSDDVPLETDTPKPADKPATDDFLPSTTTILLVSVVFGGIVALLLALQLRAVLRRMRR